MDRTGIVKGAFMVADSPRQDIRALQHNIHRGKFMVVDAPVGSARELRQRYPEFTDAMNVADAARRDEHVAARIAQLEQLAHERAALHDRPRAFAPPATDQRAEATMSAEGFVYVWPPRGLHAKHGTAPDRFAAPPPLAPAVGDQIIEGYASVPIVDRERTLFRADAWSSFKSDIPLLFRHQRPAGGILELKVDPARFICSRLGDR